MTPRDYHLHGLSVIACGNGDGGKAPIGPWLQAQKSITQPPESSHYGIVCGAVSGGLECIDYDLRHDYTSDAWGEWCDIVRHTNPDLYDRLLIESTQSDGYHVVYRCAEVPIPASQALAHTAPDTPATFATKGEGGYFICAPSPGYKLLQGDYAHVPTVTAEERDLLLTAARSLTTLPPDEDPRDASQRAYITGTMGYGHLSPFDDYDARADTVALLSDHGWRVAYTKNTPHGQAVYLTRPGKQTGVSATYNHVPNRLYVFSTSTPFPANRTYKPCAVYAYLEHKADFTAAARELISQGYGSRGDGRTRTRTVTLTDGTEIPGEEVDHEFVIEAAFNGHLGDARLLDRLTANTIAYDPALRRWCIFDHPELQPGHWGIDPTDDGVMVRLIAQERLSEAYTNAARHLQADVSEAKDAHAVAATGDRDAARSSRLDHNAAKARLKSCQRKANRMMDVTYASNVLRQLKSLTLITGDEWDADPMVLGVANGVVDLTTGKLRTSNPSDFILRVSPTPYNPNASCPRFIRFIHEIHGESPDDDFAPYTDFMHRLLGYAITGKTTDHVAPIMYGDEGRNGKDTLLNTLYRILGPQLAKPVSKDVVIEAGRRNNSGRPTPELFDLRGARLVWVNETEETDRLKAAQIKEITGGGVISCRPLHGNQVTFTATHKVLLVTNNKPHAPSSDTALWERIALIPYTQRFIANPTRPNERKADRDLHTHLMREASGILTWLVQGSMRWVDEGLTRPSAITAASAEYRSEMDNIAQWIEEECVEGPGEVCLTSRLYESYREWSVNAGVPPVGRRRFTADLLKRNYVSIRNEQGISGRGIQGLSLPKSFHGSF